MKEDEITVFINKFVETYQKEKEKLPYNINLVELIKANENAHSRILCKLLQYKNDKGKYEILENLTQYIQNKYPEKEDFQRIKVKKPKITQEIKRIDLWIRDNDYAIIIENKINWAIDQEEQLASYIKTTEDYGFKAKPIYVIYLTLTYEKEATNNSWGKYINSSIYQNRYLQLSFKDDILPWLKEKLMPQINEKEKGLCVALEQYIDYFEGKFCLKKINIEMTKELQNSIKTNLKLDENFDDNIKKLDEVINQLTFARKIAFLQQWQEQLEKYYEDQETEIDEDEMVVLRKPIVLTDGNYPKVYYPFNGYKAAIQYGINDSEPIYGVVWDDTKNNQKLKEELSKKGIKETRGSDWWYCQEKTTEENALKKLKELITKLEKPV